ncbi:AEC family transporter [Achromobacter sp. GG226]|uniref:AEC family transporter n=1 Tax=Verticiella alkaliphila TaxID=2779529 RepID=UPI001C0CBD24|nr:AEC family transporter [Verticiella sp. GG226]
MSDILAVTGPLFFIIALGFLAVRFGLFGRGDMRVLGAFVINVALPAVLIHALSQRDVQEILDVRYLFAYGLGSLAALAVGIGIARWGLKRGMAASALAGMGTAMSNSAFIGFPLALQLVGPVAAIAAALAMLIENLLILPLVLALAERGEGHGLNVRTLARQIGGRLVRHPVIIAIVVGMTLSLLGWHLPLPAARGVEMLATASAPAALFAIGGALAGQAMRGLATDITVIAVGKLVIHPLLVLLALLLVPDLDPAMRVAAIVIAASPMLTVYPLMGQKYGHEAVCTATLVMTTIVAFFTLSAVVGLLGA